MSNTGLEVSGKVLWHMPYPNESGKCLGENAVRDERGVGLNRAQGQ